MTTVSLVPPDTTATACGVGVARLQRMLAPAGFALDLWVQIAPDCAALVELTPDHARIKRPSAALLTYTRAAGPGIAPLRDVR